MKLTDLTKQELVALIRLNAPHIEMPDNILRARWMSLSAKASRLRDQSIELVDDRQHMTTTELVAAHEESSKLWNRAYKVQAQSDKVYQELIKTYDSRDESHESS